MSFRDDIDCLIIEVNAVTHLFNCELEDVYEKWRETE